MIMTEAYAHVLHGKEKLEDWGDWDESSFADIRAGVSEMGWENMKREYVNVVEAASVQKQGEEPERRGHEPGCDKQWYTLTGVEIGSDGCPTCRAIRSDSNVYSKEILEMLFRTPGFRYEVVNDE